MEWLNRFDRVPSVSIGGRDIPLAIKRHPRARRLTMRLAPDGSEIRVTMPRWGQSREAVAFARSRREWLEQQLAAAQPVIALKSGSAVPFRGEQVSIDWHASYPRKPAMMEGALRLGGPEASLNTRLERWLRSEAETLLRNDLEVYCTRAEVSTPAIALSRAQRRWGSCSTSGTVRINWRLIMAPDFVRRSVVAHEVAHLVHFDHSPAFHSLLAAIFEGEIGAADRWLKQHGRSLYAYFG